jgi:hypothetical protein
MGMAARSFSLRNEKVNVSVLTGLSAAGTRTSTKR